MKKLRKVNSTLQDSIEAYEGVCNCASLCYCTYCPCQEEYTQVTPSTEVDYSNLESNSLSISNSHYIWA